MATDNANNAKSETAEAQLDLDPQDAAVADAVLDEEAKAVDGNNKAEGEFKRTGRMTLYVRRFFRRPSAVVGLVMLILLVIFALVGSKFGKWHYEDLDFLSLGTAPNSEHWFGTTGGGSDMYAMVVRGLGRSLAIGIISSIGTTILAAIIGTSIAFFQGWVERIGMWILDMLLVVPSFLLIAMIVRSSAGMSGWLWLIFGLVAFGWIGYARVLRTLTMSLRELDYVRAAKFMGVGSFRIILRHLVPNLGSVLIINTVLGVVGAVGSETSLSFLGLGIKAPDTSLGTLLNDGQSVVLTAPWVLIFPSIVLIMVTFSVQLIGDGLRDAIDPYSRSGGKAK
ncbi:ABC transporter permease [Bifidobacterium amazonense]|uniref:Oligopeptide transport system permease protein OppC n=2 Tax=Bifidobacterium TaxID=1678 RepID=A0A086ZLX5_9BIFI|nr:MULTISPECIES: ABC transporter permease [Bifidobacterium]KFI47525.1 binding-protein-dependent transport systems inner membrane component [Bifidobacterium biavatii DSM 23969]MCH9274821.1 ABC transporter permease [Bifidobacterium amazonense]